MKKLLLLTVALLGFSFYGTAQKKIEKLKEYTASNGVTYKIGDDLKLGRGSDTNGNFVYLKMGGWAANSIIDDTRLGATYAGLLVTIKKIRRYNGKRGRIVRFTIGGGNITNYTLDIENGIQTCEVENCTKNVQFIGTDKYDQLKKLKKLLDDGILNQEEYDAEKNKLLKRK